MRPTLRRLVAVLEEQTLLARELLELLQADQRLLVKHDVGGLEASNLAKEACMLRLQTADAERQALAEALGSELGLASDDVRVSRLAPLLGVEGPALLEPAQRLRALVASLAELIAISRGFLEQSIVGIRGLLSLITSLRAPEVATYDAQGRFASTSSTGPVAVQREV